MWYWSQLELFWLLQLVTGFLLAQETGHKSRSGSGKNRKRSVSPEAGRRSKGGKSKKRRLASVDSEEVEPRKKVRESFFVWHGLCRGKI